MNYFYLILIIFIYRDIFFYSFLFIANATIFLATNLFLYRKQTGGEIKDPNLAKKYLHFAYPLILNSIITGIASNIRLYLLGLNMSSFEVGLYGFSLTIISFFKLFVTNNRNLIQSQLFEAHNMDNKQREKKFIFDMEYMIALLFSPFFLIFILLINDILTIYPGGEYIQATSILSILLFRSAISFINIPYNELLFVNNRKIFSTIHVLNCLLYLGLIIFFPNIGSFLIVKIGLFTVLQEIIYLILNRYYARKFSNFWLNPRALKPILCAIIFFIIVYVLKRNFASINPFLNIALFGGLSVGIYLAILLLIKGFTKADLKFILNLINPKEILSNLKEEIRMDKKETK
ncbi:MAG: lipopolysaccharide biosynthesis protein [Candidatus Hodarchaeota archaeon]